MDILIRMLFLLWLACAAGTSMARCMEGTVIACTINGCKGTSTCVNGAFSPCEAQNVCPANRDTILVSNALPSEPVGVLFDGSGAAGAFNDRRANATADTRGSATVPLDSVTGGGYGNLHTIFSRGRSPTSVLHTWTSAAENLAVPLDPEVSFGVTIWILPNDFATLSSRASQAIVAMNVIYDVERTGLRVGRVTIVNASSNPYAPGLLNATADKHDQYVNNIGATAGDLNVYVTSTVDGATNRAFTWDGYPHTVIAGNALISSLLTHEFGHAFALGHTGAPAFDITSMMNPSVAEGTTRFFADGQIFEMHRHPSSQVNALFKAHVGRPAYACPGTAGAVTYQCPAIERRLWADGAFPVN